MKFQIFFILALIISSLNCFGQKKSILKVGGSCYGCEAIYEYKNKQLTSIDTLPDFIHNNPKLKITGTVYKKDRKTPAKDVIIYIYHTDRYGIYPTKGNEKGWGQKHGYLRGWTKTNSLGKYTFYTFIPSAYPNRKAPQHIHTIIKEPFKNEYYIEDILFDNDPLLTQKERAKLKKRGGSGITKPKNDKGILTIKRDIFLGLNIPNY